MRQSMRQRSKLSAIVCATILASAVSASAKDGDTRTCQTTFGGQVVCGNLTIGITLEQYEARLKVRAEEIRGEEAEKRVQLQKLMELTERATSAEKDSLRTQIAAIEAEKRALEAESKGVADRLANLQASYDGLVQKLAEANAALEAFAPLISTEAFAQAQAMLSRGDLIGAERKFIEIADTVRSIPQKNVFEARALFEAGKLAEERFDWRAASAHYASAVRLQPSNWQYAERAGALARRMGDYAAAASFDEATLKLVTSTFGAGHRETATALNNLALTYYQLQRYLQAEDLYRRVIEIDEKALGKDPNAAIAYNNLGVLLRDQGKYDEAKPLFRRAIEIGEKTLGKDHPDPAIAYNNLGVLLRDQGKYDEAEPLFRRAIEIGEKTLAAMAYDNLGHLLTVQGKHEDALIREAINTQSERGSDDPDFARLKEILQQLEKQSAGPATAATGDRPQPAPSTQSPSTQLAQSLAELKIGADEGRAQIRVLQDTWNIEAKGLEWVKYQVAEIEPIRAFLFALITGLVGTLAFFGIKGWRGVKTPADQS
jgi:tetratricopeptide (TPR) repeat protein